MTIYMCSECQTRGFNFFRPNILDTIIAKDIVLAYQKKKKGQTYNDSNNLRRLFKCHDMQCKRETKLVQ